MHMMFGNRMPKSALVYLEYRGRNVLEFVFPDLIMDLLDGRLGEANGY